MRSNHCHIHTHNMPVRISFSQVGGGGGGGSIPDERKASSTTQIIARTALVNTTTYYGEITNHYTWQGRKLGKSLRNSQGTLTLDETYYDELMLNFGKPSRINHGDGYIALSDNGGATFYYYLKDHLGNVRSVITPDANNKPVVTQANDYFPFGMSFESPIPNLSYKSTTTNKHKYNGKEEQEMPGKWLDYGARFYDAQIGRWHGVDPLAEKGYNWTPYRYAYNNPLIYIDPNGLLETEYVNKKGETLYKTDDGLADIIVIEDANINKLEDKLNELNDKGNLDDAKTNKEELHTLGTEILELKTQSQTGNSNIDVGYNAGYENGYVGISKTSELLHRIGNIIQSSYEEGAQMSVGYNKGFKEGKDDRNSGNINVMNPYSSLKKNVPILKLKPVNKPITPKKNKHV